MEACMIKHLFDIVKIVIYTSLFSFLIARFPNITFEGALVACGAIYLMLSGWVSRGYRYDRRHFKFIAPRRSATHFNEASPTLTKKAYQTAGLKLATAGCILCLLSILAFYANR
jgi:hypothetical protein